MQVVFKSSLLTKNYSSISIAKNSPYYSKNHKAIDNVWVEFKPYYINRSRQHILTRGPNCMHFKAYRSRKIKILKITILTCIKLI